MEKEESLNLWDLIPSSAVSMTAARICLIIDNSTFYMEDLDCFHCWVSQTNALLSNMYNTIKAQSKKKSSWKLKSIQLTVYILSV
jgi:hypothetical protein